MIRGRRPYTPHQGAALDPTHLDAPQFNVSGSTCETVSQSKKIGDLTSDFLTGENSTTYYWDVVEAVLAGAGVPSMAQSGRVTRRRTRRSDRQPKKNRRKVDIGAEGLGVAGNAGRSPMTSRRLRTPEMGLRPKPRQGSALDPTKPGASAARAARRRWSQKARKTTVQRPSTTPKTTPPRRNVPVWRLEGCVRAPSKKVLRADIFCTNISDRATALVEVH